MKLNKTLSAITLGFAAIATVPATAYAQAYPTKPVKFVVGFTAGNSIDSVARIIANALNKKFAHPVIVENRTGANGMLAAGAVAASEPDGHTVLISNSSTITINPSLFKQVRYDVDRDFAPVNLVVSVPFILTTNPAKHPDVHTIADLIKLAKAKPGELSYGSAGLGNLTQLTYELLNNEAGVKMLHVPYKGSGAAQVGVIGGEVDSAWDNPAAMGQIRAGKLRALAVSSAQRWRDLPDTPSLAEQGYPSIDISFWVGALVPAKTPPATIKALADAIHEVTKDPETRKLLEAQGNLKSLPPKEFAEQIKKETALYKEVIQKANIELQ